MADRELQEPYWERQTHWQPPETQRQYEAFQLYLEHGSIDKAYAESQKVEQKWSKSGADSSSERASSRWFAWSTDNRWVDRRAAYKDFKFQESRRERRIKRIEQQHKRDEVYDSQKQQAGAANFVVNLANTAVIEKLKTFKRDDGEPDFARFLDDKNGRWLYGTALRANKLLPALQRAEREVYQTEDEDEGHLGKRIGEAKQDNAQSSLRFRDFVDAVRPNYQWYKHCEVLADRLQDVADGKIKRLMVFMPPRHGKSELVSRLFPAYCIYRKPDEWFAVASYAADLAYGFSRNARDNYTRYGGETKIDSSSVKMWETGIGGGMWAAGVGGQATGKGFHIGLVDDPLKNHQDAASPTIRQGQKDWWESTWYTRMEPDAALVVVQTRWNEDDLAGYLLSSESEEPEHWHIVNFPAIKEEEDQEFPATCTVEEDWRESGEALCEERYDLEKLQQFRRRGEYFWSALYQQNPTPRKGNFFDKAFLLTKIVEAAPAGLTIVRYWDKAGTEGGDGAETAGVLVGRDRDGVYYVLDVISGRWSAGNREKIIKAVAAQDEEKYGEVWIFIEQEPGSGGKQSAEETINNLDGYAVYADRVSGSKESRAYGFAAQCEVGNVFILKAVWNDAYLEQMQAFPHGKLKDKVDGSTGAYNALQEIR